MKNLINILDEAVPNAHGDKLQDVGNVVLRHGHGGKFEGHHIRMRRNSEGHTESLTVHRRKDNANVGTAQLPIEGIAVLISGMILSSRDLHMLAQAIELAAKATDDAATLRKPL